MNVFVIVLIFIIGVICVVKGGDLFVDAASWIARAFGIPTFIIGATIVSIATTLPEMIVSAMASFEGKNDMAVGNAVGSVTANTGLILAVAMLFMHVVCKRKEYMRQCILLASAAVVLWLSCYTGSVSIWGSIALIAIFVISMVGNVIDAKKDMLSDKKESADKKKFASHVIKFLAGAALIVIGSQFLINSGSAIAELLGVPERIIAVTLVAVGTSLPELVTTLTAIAKKESNLSIGNIIGANIIDIALILPVCSAVSGQRLPVSAQSIAIDIPVCIGIILLAIIPMLIREKASKVQGIAMLAAYAVYLYVIL